MKATATTSTVAALLGVAALSLLAACAQTGPVPPAADRVSAAALWEHLQDRDYRDTWDLWPGTTAQYPGKEPHGMLLTTYVNPAARDAIEARKGSLPAGAIVLKENYGPSRELAAITAMWKVDGYDPAAGNWFWAKYAPDGKVLKEGRVAGCIGCHGAARDNDYLFTGSLR